MIRFLAFLLALLVSSVSFSQALPNPVWTPGIVGGTYTFSGASATSANAASLAFGNAANGALYAEANQALALGGGRSAVVAIRSAPSMLNVAKAIGGFAAGPYVGALILGVSLYDLAKERGFNVDNSTGVVVVTKQPDSLYTCNASYPPDPYVNTSGTSRTKVCVPTDASASSFTYGWSITSAQFGWTGVKFPCGNASCRTGSLWNGVGTTSPANVVLSPQIISSLQELQDSIASQSGWPSGSALPRAVQDAVKSGEVLPLPAPYSITGPTFLPGSPSVQTNPDGSKVTTTTDKKLTYAPPSVTVNDEKRVTITDPNGVTTPGPVTEEPPPDMAPSDTELPGQPDLYKQKYPDGLKDVWTTRKAELMASPLANLPGNLMPSIPMAGGYPSWPLPVVIGHWNFGTYDVSPAPMVWDFLRVCVLIGALFLARALIFGG